MKVTGEDLNRCACVASCISLGDCTDNPAFCPLDLARSLISSLNFERFEVMQ